MDFDEDSLIRTASLVRDINWQIDFMKNPQLQGTIFQAELQKLIAGLREVVSKLTKTYAHVLHPRHVLELDVKTTFGVFLKTKGDATLIGSCHIDTTTIGVLRLHITAAGVPPRVDELVLIRGSENHYLWRFENKTLISSELPYLVVERLLDSAGDSLRTELASIR